MTLETLLPIPQKPCAKCAHSHYTRHYKTLEIVLQCRYRKKLFDKDATHGTCTHFRPISQGDK